MAPITTYILISTLVLLVLISGFFSVAETSMMAINRYRLRHLARKGKPAAKRVAQLLERPDRLLGVVLIGNNLATIAASSVATMLAEYYFGDVGVVVTMFVLTVFILIFSEVAPKTIAALYPQHIAFPISRFLQILLKIFYPLVWLINAAANGVLKFLGMDIKKHGHELLSMEELRMLVREASGNMSSGYQHMLLRILNLEHVLVEDIMIPRSEIVGIDIAEDWSVISEKLNTIHHDHFPIYRDNIDQVVGILDRRKIWFKLINKETLTKEHLLSMTEEVYFIPEMTLLNRQLLNFQRENKAAGLVIDEYGDIQGLVTAQDIVQEIVGQFAKDLDDVTRLVKKQSDGSFIVDASVGLRDLNRAMHWELPVDGPKTLSGLIVERLEFIPDSPVSLQMGNYRMEVVDISDNKILFVKIWLKVLH